MSDYPPSQPMEEILASIKRIIAEDVPLGQGARLAADPSDDADEDTYDPGEPIAPAPASAGDTRPARAPSSPDADALLSASSEAASRQALAALSAMSIDPQADANTLDGLVREMLRPMLKQWLDTNLPGIVERMVAREIARLGR